MRLQNPIWLPVFIYDSADEQLHDLGIKKPLDDLDTVQIAFFDISSVEPGIEEDVNKSILVSGGKSYWVNVEAKKLVEMIKFASNQDKRSLL